MQMDNEGNMIPTENIFAVKVVSKQLLLYDIDIQKEVEINRSLNHKHVAGFQTAFEDTNFVYLVLELCKNGVISAY